MLSLIMCSRDETRFARARAMYENAFAGIDHEIVRIADARSMSEGYNRGLAAAKGELVLLSHDDIELLSADFAQRLLGHMERFDLLGVAGTTRLIGPAWIHAGPPYLYGQLVHPDPNPEILRVSIYSAPARSAGAMQAIDGVLMCARRRVLERVPFDERYDHFHLYDIDFSFSAHRAGFSVGVACDLDVFHNSFGGYNNPDWVRAAHAFMEKHGQDLTPMPFPLKWQGTVARVNSRADAVRLLHPDHWT